MKALRVWQVEPSKITPVYLVDYEDMLVSGKFFKIKNYEWDEYLIKLARQYNVKYWGYTTNSGAHWELYITNYDGPFPIMKIKRLMVFDDEPEGCGNRELKNCYEDWYNVLDFVLPWLAKQRFFDWLVEYTENHIEVYEVAPLKELADNALARLEQRTNKVNVYRLELYPRWLDNSKLWSCDGVVQPFMDSDSQLVHSPYGYVCTSKLRRSTSRRDFSIVKVDEKAILLNREFNKLVELDEGIYLLVYKFA